MAEEVEGTYVPYPTVTYRVAQFIENVRGVPLEDLLITASIRETKAKEENPYKEEDEFVLNCFEDLYIALNYDYKVKEK